jgi:RNA polymerase sigma factor (sigma-70 family)
MSPEPSRDSSLAPVEDFAALYTSLVPRLVTLLMLLGASYADAADAAQRTMIQLYRRRDTVRDPQAWARRVARRELLHGFTERERPVGEVPEPPALLQPSPQGEWERRHDLLTILARLPQRQREVLALTIDGYQPAEIAEELGIAGPAVRASLYKARQAVAAFLLDERFNGSEGGEP